MRTWPAVLSRLLRADRLDVEVAYVPRRRTRRDPGIPATGGTPSRRGEPGAARPGG